MARRLAAAKLAIATHNPGKLVEIRDLLAPYGIATAGAAELGVPEPEETGADVRRERGLEGARRRRRQRPARLGR